MKKTYIAKINCDCCQIQFDKRLNVDVSKNSKANYCSLECKNKHCKSYWTDERKIKQSGQNSGENNPNYGNKWSNEQRELQREKLIEIMRDSERRFKSGNANRGKKFDQDRIDRMHKNRTKESYSHLHNEETKKKIGELSKERMANTEYKLKFRKTMEDNGYWIKLSDKPLIDIYKNLSNWNRRMFDSIEDENQLELLKTLGVFNCRTNKKGIVRDHIFSRLDGFEQGVFPEILRHPANCQVLTHSDNCAKKASRYRDRSDITLEQLFERIESYTREWHEQAIVLDRIKNYKEGVRWNYE